MVVVPESAVCTFVHLGHGWCSCLCCTFVDVQSSRIPTGKTTHKMDTLETSSAVLAVLNPTLSLSTVTRLLVVQRNLYRHFCSYTSSASFT